MVIYNVMGIYFSCCATLGNIRGRGPRFSVGGVSRSETLRKVNTHHKKD